MIDSSIYRFRVSIQGVPSSSFILHITTRHAQPPRYLDLLYKIEQHSQVTLEIIQSHYIISIEKNDVFKCSFKDDLSLHRIFKFITVQDDNLEIKLIKKGGIDKHYLTSKSEAPIIRPNFIRRHSLLIDVEEESYNYRAVRKDSGISLEEEIGRFEKKQHDSQKLPVLSPIITTSLSPVKEDFYYLPSPPQSTVYGCKSPINLPGLSSVISDHDYQQKRRQLAPIHPYHRPSFFDGKSISPPLSSPPPNKKMNYKVARGSTTQRSQFICEHVIDKTTGKLCYQSFRRSYDLSRHQTIHLKNRPLCYCQDCGKKFTRLDALRRHERIQGHNKK